MDRLKVVAVNYWHINGLRSLTRNYILSYNQSILHATIPNTPSPYTIENFSAPKFSASKCYIRAGTTCLSPFLQIRRS